MSKHNGGFAGGNLNVGGDSLAIQPTYEHQQQFENGDFTHEFKNGSKNMSEPKTGISDTSKWFQFRYLYCKSAYS